MSESAEGFGDIAGDAVDALYDFGYAAGALATGDLDVAADRFLDASGEAINVITGGVAGQVADRFEEDTGVDVREFAKDAVEDAGNAMGDAAYAAGEAIEEWWNE